MLSQIRLRGRHARALAPMRCSLGYALHSDEDVARCRAVEGPGDCWKAIPSWRVATIEPRAPERENGVAAGSNQAVATTSVVVELVEAPVTTGDDSADGD